MEGHIDSDSDTEIESEGNFPLKSQLQELASEYLNAFYKNLKEGMRPFNTRALQEEVEQDSSTSASNLTDSSTTTTTENDSSNNDNNITTEEVLTTEEDALIFQEDILQQELSYVDLMFEITGTCSGCSSDDALFDDVVDRRRLDSNFVSILSLVNTPNQQKKEQDNADASASENADTDASISCECADNAENRGPAIEEFFASFVQLVESTTLFSFQVESIVEVSVSTCTPENADVTEMTTIETISIDLQQVFGGVGEDGDDGVAVTINEIEKAFVCSYNWIVTRLLCDPSYTAIKSATFINIPFEEENSGLQSMPSGSTATTRDLSSFTFEVNSTCVNCTGIFANLTAMNDEFGSMLVD